MQKKFLVLTPPGEKSAFCESVPVAVTGVFESDKFGDWNTRSDFNSNSSIYKLTMTGTSVNDQKFALIMHNFGNNLKAFGLKLEGYDVISSLVAWSSFRVVDDVSKMTFSTTADLSSILGTMTFLLGPVFASKEGICNLSSTFKTVFTPSIDNLDISASVSKDKFVAMCPDQLTANIGNFFDDSTSTSFSFDMRTVITAFSVNFGITQLSDLNLVFSAKETIGQYVNVQCSGYVDNNYPGMDFITCCHLPDTRTVCFAGSTYPLLINGIYNSASCHAYQPTRRFQCAPGQSSK